MLAMWAAFLCIGITGVSFESATNALRPVDRFDIGTQSYLLLAPVERFFCIGSRPVPGFALICLDPTLSRRLDRERSSHVTTPSWDSRRGNSSPRCKARARPVE